MAKMTVDEKHAKGAGWCQRLYKQIISLAKETQCKGFNSAQVEKMEQCIGARCAV